MKLISYKSTRAGLVGISNILIRIRLKGQISHSEVLFEPGDGVEHLVPDGNLEPIDGEYWCASSVAAEHLPEYSPKRAGATGGVRFKRVNPSPDKWIMNDVPFDPIKAAQWAKDNQGMMYDWQLILGFLVWWIPDKDNRVMCSESCAHMFGFEDPWRFDPCVLHATVQNLSNLKK